MIEYAVQASESLILSRFSELLLKQVRLCTI